MLTDYNCQQHVDKPTHRYDGLLDLIISPIGSKLVDEVKVRDMGVSDHWVLSTTLNASWTKPPCRVTYSRRNYNSIDADVFRHELLASIAYVQPRPTTNEFAVQLRDDVVAILDKLAPLKSVTKRCGKQTCGWLSKEAVESRRNRRKLERRYRQTHRDADRVAYRSACRATNKLIDRSRQEHIGSRLQAAAGNSRQRWRIANELLHNDNRRDINETDADRQKLCDTFSDFFVNKIRLIAQTIADRLALGDRISTTVEIHPPVAMNVFECVTECEVLRVINGYPLKTSPLDFVPTSLLKKCSDVFAPLICRLANASFTEGIFPEIFKVGQVTQLLKKPGIDANEPPNYRPITNLNTIGKILEPNASYACTCQHRRITAHYSRRIVRYTRPKPL